MRDLRFFVALASALALATPGCSFIVDGALHDRDTGTSTIDGGPGVDAPLPEVDGGPPPTACTGRPDGTFCDIEGLVEREICIDGVCVVSACGDGFADTRTGHPSGLPAEICDDGNPTDGDGCELDCTFSCETVADCPDDTETCNGVPTCGDDHACESMALPDTTVCDVVDTTPVVAGVCRDGTCRAGVCGNSTTEPGEDCDDGDADDADGCRADCTFTCIDDSTCQNATVCDGSEVCDLGTHTCGTGTPPVCDDGDACTTDSCNADLGCVAPSVLVDADMDGHSAITPSCGGDDCNDANPLINPSVVEGCGTTMDMNCDGMVTTMPTWYADCDLDTYARSGAPSTMSCATPTSTPSGCSGARWTSRAPTSGATDCFDTNSSARPGQTSWFSTPASGSSYDYNCDGSATREFPTNPLFTIACAFNREGICTGTTYWSESSTPACGSTATQSYCTVVFAIPSSTCSRRTRETAVRCH